MLLVVSNLFKQLSTCRVGLDRELKLSVNSRHSHIYLQQTPTQYLLLTVTCITDDLGLDVSVLIFDCLGLASVSEESGKVLSLSRLKQNFKRLGLVSVSSYKVSFTI